MASNDSPPPLETSSTDTKQPEPPTPKPFTAKQCSDRLEGWIEVERPKLGTIYKGDKLEECAARAATMIQELQLKGCSLEYAKELSTLVLYNIVMLLGE